MKCWIIKGQYFWKKYVNLDQSETWSVSPHMEACYNFNLISESITGGGDRFLTKVNNFWKNIGQPLQKVKLDLELLIGFQLNTWKHKFSFIHIWKDIKRKVRKSEFKRREVTF